MRSPTEPLAVFRFVLGATFWFWASNFLSDDRWNILFVQPVMRFKYAGFEWVQLWPGDGMWWHFQVTRVAAVLFAIGFATRLNAFLLACSMTYVILVERMLYNNHDYLLACTAFLCVFLPCAKSLSVDRWIAARWSHRSNTIFDQTMPRWQWWLLRFQLGLPYFFGGIAKLDRDWLRGQPAGIFVDTRVDTPLIGGLFGLPHAASAMAYGGLAFDLLVVPALLWKRTRPFAVIAALTFHLTNATIFQIGVFPWFMLASLFVFFPEQFIPKLLGRSRPVESACQPEPSQPEPSQPEPSQPEPKQTERMLSTKNQWSMLTLGQRLALIYVIIHLLLPIRPWVLPGNPSWNERGHRYAWRMMLRHKECLLWFKLESDDDFLFAPASLVMTPNQIQRAPRNPEMIRQAAVKIKAMAASLGQDQCRVHALALVSLNGRLPTMMVDPDVDLTSVRQGWFINDWVPQDPGPFRETAWIEPYDNWWPAIEMPARFRQLAQYRVSEAQKLFDDLAIAEKQKRDQAAQRPR